MIEFIGGFESTYLPAHDVDVAELTEHDRQFATDVALLRRHGVRRVRYPVRWHRVEAEPGHFRWQETDWVLNHLLAADFEVIVDLVHHTSYPRWLDQGFGDRRFPAAYLRYAEAFANRYPNTMAYTLFNEPLATLYLCGHEGIWPPFWRGINGLVRLLRAVLPAVANAARMYHELLPRALHVYNDTCERHSLGSPELGAEEYTELANDRRFFVLDVLLGRIRDTRRPFVEAVLSAGGEDLLGIESVQIDVLGLDYYAHNQWHFLPGRGFAPTPTPYPLSALISEYWSRYQLPCLLNETNIRGYPSDRASWLKYTLEQCENAAANGVQMVGYSWFPFIDSCDWYQLLHKPDRRIDPVGVYWLDMDLNRRPSVMSSAYALAASGTPARELPAYYFRQPVVRWLRGFLPFMNHWDWRPPPQDELGRNPPNMNDPSHLHTEELVAHLKADGYAVDDDSWE